jgi:hypothetical protein
MNDAKEIALLALPISIILVYNGVFAKPFKFTVPQF